MSKVKKPSTDSAATPEVTEPPVQAPVKVRKKKPVATNVTTVLQQIGNVDLDSWVDNAQAVGDPMFTKHDLYTTYHPLAQILRLICIQDYITRNKFDSLHRQKLQESFMPTNQISYSKNNMIRTVTQPEITWNFLEKFLNVIGKNILDITLTLQNADTKETYTISKSDVAKIIAENAYSPTLNIVRTDRVEE